MQLATTRSPISRNVVTFACGSASVASTQRTLECDRRPQLVRNVGRETLPALEHRGRGSLAG